MAILTPPQKKAPQYQSTEGVAPPRKAMVQRYNQVFNTSNLFYLGSCFWFKP